ncbi:MAG TPA: hypothetical protein VFW07_12150 [Parafilimonas sp.]|nr:hypothetical protein [Parafilimonas sp.]
MLKEAYESKMPVSAVAALQPCVSVIVPFNPKMVSKSCLAVTLQRVYDKVDKELSGNYTIETTRKILGKLQNVFNNLDYSTHRESIIIHVSPVIEKIYYLNIQVIEKVIVDTSFEIRDFVLNKEDKHEFLLLVIGTQKEEIFIGNNERLKQIVCNRAINMRKDLPQPVTDFKDPTTTKETRVINFLQYIDKGLEIILKAYPLPLFVMATEKTMSLFRQVTKHGQYITGFIQGNFENTSETQLHCVISPHIKNWVSVKEKDVMNRLKMAAHDCNLAAGIYDVWKHANGKHGQLLIVEKDFYCPAFVGSNGEMVFSISAGKENKAGIKDAIDNIIEKVLESGGDVEFVDELKKYDHIALIENYSNN